MPDRGRMPVNDDAEPSVAWDRAGHASWTAVTGSCSPARVGVSGAEAQDAVSAVSPPCAGRGATSTATWTGMRFSPSYAGQRACIISPLFRRTDSAQDGTAGSGRVPFARIAGRCIFSVQETPRAGNTRRYFRRNNAHERKAPDGAFHGKERGKIRRQNGSTSISSREQGRRGASGPR